MSRRFLVAVLFLSTLVSASRAQTPAAPAARSANLELVEKVLAARSEYQRSLELLRAHYIAVSDYEKARWAEEELIQYHRIGKQAYELDLDVPPAILGKTADKNIPNANELVKRAVQFKDKGWGNDYIDNQRRAELLLQKMLSNYPQSDKISEAAYLLGDLYESKAYKQYHRAALYFERCYQWNPKTKDPARIRAARLYEKQLNQRGKALEIYKLISNTETDTERSAEAQKKITELGGRR
jgi:hypothetical protein